MKLKYLCIFSFFFFYPFWSFSPGEGAYLIVWSVGQGQMVTYSDLKYCVHFDMGGERFPVNQLIQECGRKINQVFYSHWDWDHINFSKIAWQRLPSFCRINWPGGAGNKNKKKFLSPIPPCSQVAKGVFREISFSPLGNRRKRVARANKFSRVAVVKDKVLIPGDSPGSSEWLWQNQIHAPIRWLVLSHHGSRYSTRQALLKKLPHLKIAIASARKKRYGHPHPQVKARLSQHGVALLSTEDFNHIRIPLH